MGHSHGTGYVYLILAANGLTKIGYATDVKRRFKTISAASPINLMLLGYIEDPLARSLEWELHHAFRDRRVKNEWFELTSGDIDHITEHYDFVEVKGFYRDGKYYTRKVSI